MKNEATTQEQNTTPIVAETTEGVKPLSKLAQRDLARKAKMQDAESGNDLPDNKYVRECLEQGYVLQDFRSTDRELAKAEAQRLRDQEGKESTYVTLKFGKFGVFAREAQAKDRTRSLSRRIEVAETIANEEDKKELVNVKAQLEALLARIEAYEAK